MAEKLERRVVMVAHHSPRRRTSQTAKHFMRGFKEEAANMGVRVSFGKKKKSEHRAKGLRLKPQLEVPPEVAKQLGLLESPNLEHAERELAIVDAGGQSNYTPSKAEMMGENRMGMLVTRAKFLGHAARFLARQTNSPPQRTRLVSIYLRHSKNKGDQLTPEGYKLAREQGRRAARHILKEVKGSKKGEFPPAIVMAISHGGINKTPGPLNWVYEAITGKTVKQLGGSVMQAEGVITIANGKGETKQYFLRQNGIKKI